MTLSGRSLCPPFAPGTCLHPASQASRWTVRSRYMQTSCSPETNVSLYQDVYISDTGCQMLYKVNLPDSSCVPFGWRGRYAGPGKFCFAFPTRDRVLVFTDHSVITFLKDGTPCQSIILDDAIIDAGIWADTLYVSTDKCVREMEIEWKSIIFMWS